MAFGDLIYCKEFDEYLRCGRLEYGFLRVKCEQCHDEKLVAFSCKRRGFCPSCGARRVNLHPKVSTYLHPKVSTF